MENDITNSLRHWPQNPYKSELLNYLWNIIPGLILWSIWKERNKRIFKNQRSPIENIWNRLCGNLKETLLLRTLIQEDFPTLNNEKAILDNWQLHLPQGLHNNGPSKSSIIIKDTWTAPPKHSYKLNFDGASTGNPGMASFGGILRNHEGTPCSYTLGTLDGILITQPS